MSLRYEQHRALLRTKEFLFSLMRAGKDRRAGTLRREASACLRHFPPLTETGQPMFSVDNLSELPTVTFDPNALEATLRRGLFRQRRVWTAVDRGGEPIGKILGRGRR